MLTRLRRRRLPDSFPTPPPGPWSVDDARAEFLAAFGQLARQRALLATLCLAELALLALLLVAFITLASRSRITPYVVLVDRYGTVQAVEPVPALSSVPDRITVHALSDFIVAARTVSSDPLALADSLRRAYRYVPRGNPRSRTFLDSYFRIPDNDPRILARSLRRTVQIASVVELPKTSSLTRATTWRVRWYETTFADASPDAPASETWEAYATVDLNPPNTVERIQVNPLGVFVTDLTWSAIHQADPPKERTPR